MEIYFIKRNDGHILTNNIGLPEVWENGLLCEAMCSQLNSTSKKINGEYAFKVITSKAL